MEKRRQIIHCDNCGGICMACENFCCHCGRDRNLFAWQAVPLNSEGWWRREKMRVDLLGHQYEKMGFLHCDLCYSVLPTTGDVFCGYCRKPIDQIKWSRVPIRSDEWSRREDLRTRHNGEMILFRNLAIPGDLNDWRR